MDISNTQCIAKSVLYGWVWDNSMVIAGVRHALSLENNLISAQERSTQDGSAKSIHSIQSMHKQQGMQN